MSHTQSDKGTKRVEYVYDGKTPLINQNCVVTRGINIEMHGSPREIIEMQKHPIDVRIAEPGKRVRLLTVDTLYQSNTTDFTYLMISVGLGSDFLNVKEYTDIYLEENGRRKLRTTKCFAWLPKTKFGVKEKSEEQSMKFNCNTEYCTSKIMQKGEIMEAMSACKNYISRYGALFMVKTHGIRTAEDYGREIINLANLLSVEDVVAQHRKMQEKGEEVFTVSTGSNRAFFNLINMLYDSERRAYMNRDWPVGDKDEQQTHSYKVMEKALDFIKYVQSFNGTQDTLQFKLRPVVKMGMRLKDHTMKVGSDKIWNLGVNLKFTFVIK